MVNTCSACFAAGALSAIVAGCVALCVAVCLGRMCRMGSRHLDTPVLPDPITGAVGALHAMADTLEDQGRTEECNELRAAGSTLLSWALRDRGEAAP